MQDIRVWGASRLRSFQATLSRWDCSGVVGRRWRLITLFASTHILSTPSVCIPVSGLTKDWEWFTVLWINPSSGTILCPFHSSVQIILPGAQERLIISLRVVLVRSGTIRKDFSSRLVEPDDPGPHNTFAIILSPGLKTLRLHTVGFRGVAKTPPSQLIIHLLPRRVSVDARLSPFRSRLNYICTGPKSRAHQPAPGCRGCRQKEAVPSLRSCTQPHNSWTSWQWCSFWHRQYPQIHQLSCDCMSKATRFAVRQSNELVPTLEGKNRLLKRKNDM